MFEFARLPHQRYPASGRPRMGNASHLLIQPQPKSGRPCPAWRRREYVAAILYVNDLGGT